MKTDSGKHVSVIIPCYNADSFVGETIVSVLEQTWPQVELVVVDDGSSDNSWQVIQSFGERVKAVRQTNGGGCRARNVGAKAARGDYLMFLDADDTLAPDTLEHLVHAIGDGGDIAACPWRRLENKGDGWVKAPSSLTENPPRGDFLLGWLSGWYIPPCAILWRREAYEATGGWDENLTANQDGDLVLRALLAGNRIVRTTAGEAFYRDHGTVRLSTSKNIGSVKALRSRMLVLEKVTARLSERGALATYAVTIGQTYHNLARNNFANSSDLARECVRLSETYAGSQSVIGSFLHCTLCRLLGVERKERLAGTLSELGILNGMRRQSEKLRRL